VNCDTDDQSRDDQDPVAGVAHRDQRGDHGDHHADRGDQVTAHCGFGAGQTHQAVDEHAEGDDVETVDQIGHIVEGMHH
jgi:hypothetical protein